jgi:biotin carboxyl carrier protein
MTATKKNSSDKDKKPSRAVVVDNFVVEFRKYKTELNRKFLERKPWVPKDESKVVSFIPGTVTSVYVTVGEHVEEGKELMILEAMKMKNRIYADRPGVVKKINVAVGERVPKSKVMFELDLD